MLGFGFPSVSLGPDQLSQPWHASANASRTPASAIRIARRPSIVKKGPLVAPATALASFAITPVSPLPPRHDGDRRSSGARRVATRPATALRPPPQLADARISA